MFAVFFKPRSLLLLLTYSAKYEHLTRLFSNTFEYIFPFLAYSNLGNVLVDRGKLEEGEMVYRKALRYRFNMADTHYNL